MIVTFIGRVAQGHPQRWVLNQVAEVSFAPRKDDEVADPRTGPEFENLYWSVDIVVHYPASSTDRIPKTCVYLKYPRLVGVNRP